MVLVVMLIGRLNIPLACVVVHPLFGKTEGGEWAGCELEKQRQLVLEIADHTLVCKFNVHDIS